MASDGFAIVYVKNNSPFQIEIGKLCINEFLLSEQEYNLPSLLIEFHTIHQMKGLKSFQY